MGKSTHHRTHLLAVAVVSSAVFLLVVRQIDRLCLPTLRQLQERRDVAVVELAGELQASIDEHADASAQQLHGTYRRAELPGLLRSM
jgi:hypothetical protein